MANRVKCIAQLEIRSRDALRCAHGASRCVRGASRCLDAASAARECGVRVASLSYGRRLGGGSGRKSRAGVNLVNLCRAGAAVRVSAASNLGEERVRREVNSRLRPDRALPVRRQLRGA